MRRVWEALEGRRLPAMAVDLEAFDRNVAAAAGLVASRPRGSGPGGMTLRLATKSIRVPELIRRVLKFGAPYRGLMTYSAEETAFLASEGFDDFLLAYPTVQKSDVEAVVLVHQSGKTVRLMIDSVDHLRILSALVGMLDQPLELVIDIDMSLRPALGLMHLGVRRSPVRSARDVVALYDECKHLPNLRIVGLMGYEAQIAGLGDRSPFHKAMNPVFQGVRAASVRSVSKLRHEAAEAVRAAGHTLTLFNGGGSGSLNTTVEESWLTEATVGSGLLCSHLFSYYSNIRYEPAFWFALQVARSSDAGYATCLGGGYIASGAPGWDKVPVPEYPPGLSLIPDEGCGEVQTPLQSKGDELSVGSRVLFRPSKAGEPAERFNEYLLVENGEVTGSAKTYRGMGKAFL
ncbi:MAG: alanine racemase [Bdellovibrionales bacterium]|nr:alanine racemase [Bdellovibrionales bacterium]